MSTTKKQNLFADVTTQESSTVSGGTAVVNFNLDSYLFSLGAGLQFGNPGLTADETQFAWENSIVAVEIIPAVANTGVNVPASSLF
ncbi:MAG: hypothetical protein QNJ49_21655 [Mastigocoleus sp. MO_167.B18]|uniref:hypothetical protein n=1 Tax=Mastigocoleus sp. MO_188.B34 TaxID=3036635 RepID=UPI00263A0ACB|nr:hypothetical protein [Mastigocoleus sp. MO_188.B34]MDJ0695478.1 hypothetical protein [Mastigocoleus sp. MO_188.B34]MDJ0775994.1 hypothetical protein [Mastigocoleus sp. MO_167.B18]